MCTDWNIQGCNKPKAEVHPRHKLTGPKEEEEEEEEEEEDEEEENKKRK